MFCNLPQRPIDTRLLSAYSILVRTRDSSEAFFDAYATVRKARKAKGSATDHEQDLLRAALIFATAGLDSMVKQLIRDTLQAIISKNEGAQAQFADYVQSKLNRSNSVDLRILAESISAQNPSLYLQQMMIIELSSSSLQSKDQLLRVGSYFAIPASEISNDLKRLKAIFDSRNEIVHEMDILLGQPNRGRRQRKHGIIKKDTMIIFETAVAYYSAVSQRLDSIGKHNVKGKKIKAQQTNAGDA